MVRRHAKRAPGCETIRICIKPHANSPQPWHIGSGNLSCKPHHALIFYHIIIVNCNSEKAFAGIFACRIFGAFCPLFLCTLHSGVFCFFTRRPLLLTAVYLGSPHSHSPLSFRPPSTVSVPLRFGCHDLFCGCFSVIIRNEGKQAKSSCGFKKSIE